MRRCAPGKALAHDQRGVVPVVDAVSGGEQRPHLALDRLDRRSEAIEHYRIFIRIAPAHYAAFVAQVQANLAGY